MLTVALVVSTGMTAGAEAAQKTPRGFHIVKVKQAGFSIAVPDEWSVVDPTRKNADQILAPLRVSAPFSALEIPDAASLAANKVVLFVFDDQLIIDINDAEPSDPLFAKKGDTAENSLVTVTVGFDPGQTEPPTVSDAAANFAQFAAPGQWALIDFELEIFGGTAEADISETKIAGVEAIKAELDYLLGVTDTLEEEDKHMIQYNLTGKRGGYFFRFETSGGTGSPRTFCPCAPTRGDLDALDTFDTMADSIRLLKAGR